MFQVDVMKYCEGCPEFAPKATAQTVIYADDKPAIECPPVIICEHRHLCERIRKFFGLPDEE